MIILGIESSCDETGAGVVSLAEDGTVTVLADVVASSMAEHARFGGVVPEIASRAHLEAMGPTVRKALKDAGVQRPDAVAVTIGPGLAGALMVGAAAAKAYAAAWGVPLYAVNHLGGHVAVATLAGQELPHTVALLVDNLADSAGLVDRLHDSILGEIQRRQHVLQQAGNLANVAEYNAIRDARLANPSLGESMDPLPVLFIVIDEFGELLAAKPEFIELFVQIGRIGRSIGMHLLLASQRLEEGRLRGLESYLSYRVGLRTFSATESRTAIGTTDAHELPPIPGSGYLKVDPDIFERFKAAYVSGVYESSEKQESRELPPVPMPFELHNTTESWLVQRAENTALELKQREAEQELTKETRTIIFWSSLS